MGSEKPDMLFFLKNLYLQLSIYITDALLCIKYQTTRLPHKGGKK